MDPITTYAQALLLGIVEGLTEFIPVSSTGHLILLIDLLGFTGPPGKVFEIVIQLGAICAVCWLFRVKLWQSVIHAPHDPQARRFIRNITIAFLPSMVLGATLHGFIKSVLFSPYVVSVALIVGGFIILWIERYIAKRGTSDALSALNRRAGLRATMRGAQSGAESGEFCKERGQETESALSHAPWQNQEILPGANVKNQAQEAFHGASENTIESFSWKLALGIGFCQTLAMIPGVSRSGATIMGGLLLGASRKTATEFSFFLAIPTMLGATVYDLYKNWNLLTIDGWGIIAIGFVSAALAGGLVVGSLIRFIQRHGFAPFAFYRIALGSVMLCLLLFR